MYIYIYIYVDEGSPTVSSPLPTTGDVQHDIMHIND